MRIVALAPSEEVQTFRGATRDYLLMLIKTQPILSFCHQIHVANSSHSHIALKMDSEWRDLFTQKSIHEIREIVYETRAKATAKKSELRQVVRCALCHLQKRC